MKIQGSRKCNGKCPSKIKATINNKTKRVEVCFIETHAGHKNQLKHINIPNEDKKQIASQLKLGIPFNNVLHNVRCSLTDEKLKRVHLVTRNDLINITNSFGLNSFVRRHENDAVSVDSRIKELSEMENNPILYYKAQGEQDINFTNLKEDDFLLAIMNQSQKELFLTFGSKCVAIDSTHGTNSYDFQLTTLMVLDEQRYVVVVCGGFHIECFKYYFFVILAKVFQLHFYIQTKLIREHLKFFS